MGILFTLLKEILMVNTIQNNVLHHFFAEIGIASLATKGPSGQSLEHGPGGSGLRPLFI